MSDRSMPDYGAEPSEYESGQAANFPRHVMVEIKSFTNRIQLAHTLQALNAIKRDIQQSSLVNNFEAKEHVRTAGNARAVELGFKGERGERWWN